MSGSDYAVDAAGAAGHGDAPVFARNSTGLVRELSPWRAFILTFGWVNLGSGAATFLAFALFMYPGTIPWIPLTLGMVLGLIYGWVYVLMGHAMPRTGGDYVWTSRIVHPALGFGVSLLWIFLSIFLLAYQMSITTTVGISTSFGILGAILRNDGLTQIGASINTPAWTFIIGTGLLVLFAALNLYSIRWTFRVLTAILILGIVSFGIIVVLLAVTSQAQFAANVDSLFGAGSFQNVISTADDLGFLVPVTLGASITATPIAFLAYEGFNYSVNAGGEIRRPQRSLIISIIGAQVLGWIGLALVSIVAINTVSYDFLSGASSLFYNAPDSYPFHFPPWLNALAGIAGSSVPGGTLLVAIMLLGFTAILAIFGGILPFVIARNIFAAAFDRVLPTKLAEVHPRFHTPTWAIIVTFVIAEIFLAIYTFTTFFTLLVNYVTGRALGIGIVGAVALAFPYLKPDLFERAPALVRARIGGIPVITLAGAATVVIMAVQFIVLVQNSALSGPTTPIAIGMLPGLIVLGIVIYFVSAWYHRREGVNISRAFSEIPPE
jgi:basic amino acid/polyamine antiporter, APA family